MGSRATLDSYNSHPHAIHPPVGATEGREPRHRHEPRRLGRLEAALVAEADSPLAIPLPQEVDPLGKGGWQGGLRHQLALEAIVTTKIDFALTAERQLGGGLLEGRRHLALLAAELGLGSIQKQCPHRALHLGTTPEQGTAHLLTGAKITPLEAIQRFNCMSCSQRLGDLRRDEGIPIQSRFITTPTGKKVKEYWLEPSYIQSVKGVTA